MVLHKPVRVRFAPSPTGDPHVGSLWTAQFNWMFARQHRGTFVLRIEDTDQQRFVPGSLQKIYEALAWYDVLPDEGPEQGGPHGPYIQSQRLAMYHQHVAQLVEQGRGYYCFCTTARLAELRQQQLALKQPPRYDKRCASIPPTEAKRRVEAGEPSVIRIKLPPHGTIVLDDVIRGRVTFRFDQLDDSVLLKADGFPTYHLANVVDDHLMEISHIIRAEEWLPSAPKHLFLYDAFGWTPPVFAHLPLLLGPDRSKLSKRHGATSALAYRDEGFLPEAMQNFLALMGWHPKGDHEVLSRQEILSEFRLADIHPAGAIFDRRKLEWMNGVYIRNLPIEQLLERLSVWWKIPGGEKPAREWTLKALALVRERMKRLSEINELINFVFTTGWNEEAKAFDRALLTPKPGRKENVPDNLRWAKTWLEGQVEPWDDQTLKAAMLAAIAKAEKKNINVLWPLRVALTLRAASPDVFAVLALLGRAESLRRIEHFL